MRRFINFHGLIGFLAVLAVFFLCMEFAGCGANLPGDPCTQIGVDRTFMTSNIRTLQALGYSAVEARLGLTDACGTWTTQSDRLACQRCGDSLIRSVYGSAKMLHELPEGAEDACCFVEINEASCRATCSNGVCNIDCNDGYACTAQCNAEGNPVCACVKQPDPRMESLSIEGLWDDMIEPTP